jgi:hypothetical protein
LSGDISYTKVLRCLTDGCHERERYMHTDGEADKLRRLYALDFRTPFPAAIPKIIVLETFILGLDNSLALYP